MRSTPSPRRRPWPRPTTRWMTPPRQTWLPTWISRPRSAPTTSSNPPPDSVPTHKYPTGEVTSPVGSPFPRGAIPMRKPSLARLAGLAAMAGFVFLSSRSAQAAEKWVWDITPYLWASSVRADVSLDGDPVLGADVKFKDIVDDVDLAAEVHFEGRHGQLGFFTDAIFISLTGEQTRSANPPLPGGTETEADVDLGLYEAGGFYRLKNAPTGLDILYGIRVIDDSEDVTITVPPPISATVDGSAGDTYTDGIIGV